MNINLTNKIPWVGADEFDEIESSVSFYEPTRPEHDPLEAVTMEAIPVLNSVHWETVIKSDDFYEDVTDIVSQDQIKWNSWARQRV